ncbi:hypothetical protein Syun_006503 [Stephania yunnanensis]|uniref:Uncharacterized protein n=1 Tax=Stephania yunnanensis TaxID=152371 RepID=A0AAP0PXL9_9MAGN
MHKGKDMDMFQLERDFNVPGWACGQPRIDSCYCHVRCHQEQIPNRVLIFLTRYIVWSSTPHLSLVSHVSDSKHGHTSLKMMTAKATSTKMQRRRCYGLEELLVQTPLEQQASKQKQTKQLVKATRRRGRERRLNEPGDRRAEACRQQLLRDWSPIKRAVAVADDVKARMASSSGGPGGGVIMGEDDEL